MKRCEAGLKNALQKLGDLIIRLRDVFMGEARLDGSGAIAQGEGATAVGERGVAARDVYGPVVTGDHNVIPDSARAAADRARARYLTRLYQECSVLPLAAMGGEEGVGDEVSLNQVYVDLDTRTRVPLTEEEKAAREEEPSFSLRGEDREGRPLTALEAATQARRLALLGDPGSGKSTFVRQLAARSAEAYGDDHPPFPEWEAGLLPVLITLRELAPALAALDLARLSEAERDARLVATMRQHLTAKLRAWKAEAWDGGLEDALLAGDVLLILDGLDEVAEACRGRVRRAVGALLRTYGDMRRVVVTCRMRSYTGDAVLPGFVPRTLAPFDEEKIRAFVEGWYRAQQHLGRLREAVAEARAEDLQQAALRESLRELASNPMLLTTMALIHQKEVGLPRERVRLYDLAVRVLLTRWQTRKGLEVSPELAAVLRDDLKLRAIMERLAYEAHQGQADRSRAADLERRDLLAVLEDSAYLDDIGLAAAFLDYVDQRAGLLVGQGGTDGGAVPKTYTFPHRTFQEYLAGCYLAGDWDALDLYWQRAGEGDAWSWAARLGAEELRYNRRSEKTLLNLAYDLVPDAEPETERAWRAGLWSGQMAALFPPAEIRRMMRGPKSGAAYLDRLSARLVRILREQPLDAVERAEAGRVLAKLGDPRSGMGVREDGLPDIAWCAVPAGPFVMGSTDADEMADDDEKPQHMYEIERPYAISTYPITNAQYDAFVEAGGYGEVRYWTRAAREKVWAEGQVKMWYEDEPREAAYDFGEPFNLPNHPVVGVTWYEAAAFCRWLTEVMRARGELTNGQAIHLPTEPQWEKAARGTDGRRYPWGDKPDPERANYGDTGIGTTSAVGVFPGGASPYDVEEMSGNVWEWCRTKWGSEYEGYRPDNDLEGSAGRVLRGGAFLDGPYGVRCASRRWLDPLARSYYLGFRVVVPPCL